MSALDSALFLVSLFVMVGTVGAAIAALSSTAIARKSLERQEEQYKKTLEPLIVPKAMTYARKVNFDIVSFIYNNFSEAKPEDFRFKYKGEEVPLLNLSNGIAKDIKIKSEVIKYDGLVKAIKDIDLKKFNILNMRIIDELNKKKLLINAENEISNFGERQPIELFSEQEIIYLTNKVEDFKVIIPKSFVIFQNLYNYLSFIERVPNLTAPMLVFTINYKDIASNSYTAKYTMEINKIAIKTELNSQQLHEMTQILNFCIKEYKNN